MSRTLCAERGDGRCRYCKHDPRGKPRRLSLKWKCPICGAQYRGPRQKQDCVDRHISRFV